MTEEPTTNPVPPVEQGPPPDPTAPPAQSSLYNPHDALGILSFAFAFAFPPAGLICGIIGLREAKKQGYESKLSLIGLWMSAVIMAVGVLLFIVLLFTMLKSIQSLPPTSPNSNPSLRVNTQTN